MIDVLMYKPNINTDAKQITCVLLRILVRFSWTKIDFKIVVERFVYENQKNALKIA